MSDVLTIFKTTNTTHIEIISVLFLFFYSRLFLLVKLCVGPWRKNIAVLSGSSAALDMVNTISYVFTD